MSKRTKSRKRSSAHIVPEVAAKVDSNEKREWTAVYPLPSLASFARKFVRQQKANLSADILCTESAIEAVAACWLCTVTDLPDWHFRHRRVRHGYRRCRTFLSALQSVFHWHNESVNIWSHFAGSAMLVRKVLLVSDILGSMDTTEAFSGDASMGFRPVELQAWFLPLLTLCLVLGSVVPIASSAFCHSFYCINPWWHRVCWFTDFVGLMLGVLGITAGYLMIALLSCPEGSSSAFFLVKAAVVAFWTYFVYACYRRYHPRISAPVLTPSDRFPEFAANMSLFSAVCFFLATGATLVACPFYFSEAPFQSVMRNVCLFPVLLGLSILIFAQGGVPERFTHWMFLPQHTFDLLGHSHQFWHVASWGILYLWIDVAQQHFTARLERGCPANF